MSAAAQAQEDSVVEVDLAKGVAAVAQGPAQPFDIVLVTVKARDSEEVGRQLVHGFQGQVFNEDTAVLTLQNGMGNTETIEQALGSHGVRHTVLQGLTYQGAAMVGPLHVRRNGFGATVLEPAQHPAQQRKLEAFCELLGQLGPLPDGTKPVSLTNDLPGMLWTKFMVNTVINPIAAMVDGENQSVLDPRFNRLIRQGADEVVQLAARSGVKLRLGGAQPADYIKGVARATATNTCSTVADLRAGKQTEVEALNGFAIRAAAEHPVLQVPVQQMFYTLLKSLESRM